MRKAQLPGNVVSQTAQTHRADVGRCRQRRRPDIGKRAADVHPTLPISARPHACTEARRRQRRLNVGSRYRPDRMLAQRLDVGNVGSMSEADIGPTACLHRGSTSATSAQCRKPISARPHACTEARRRQRRLNVGSRYRPDRMLAQRLDVGNVGSMSEADIGPTACLHRGSTSATSAQCRKPISGRPHACTEARRRQRRLNVEADIGPTACLHRGSTSATSAQCRKPISARPHACTEARRRQRRLNVGSRYRPDRMLAQRLDVGNVGSMSEADIGPTACLHRGSTSATSAQCRKPISGRPHACTEARRRQRRLNVGSRYRADVYSRYCICT